ncbi:MAG: phosphoenolpyruvate synthase [Bacteriovoracaceae bacterium]|nr:phosphoenolpyruvate synthase [Bacteriovoracaceae bacterium]
MLIVNKKSTKNFAKKNAGGKGYNLYLLANAGLNVPEWIVLGKKFFERFKRETNFDARLAEILGANGDNLAQTEKDVEHFILTASMSEGLESAIRESYNKLGRNLISVRSSAIDEDSAGHSFAGQLSSYLYISSEDSALESVKKCWASAYSERGLYYRRQNKLETVNIDVGVVLQEMIDSEKSGVAFTADPVSGKSDRVILNAVYGVGEGIVSGLLDADTYTVMKADCKIEQSEIVEKGSKLCRDGSNDDCIELPVEESLINVPCLSDGELTLLTQTCCRIENYYLLPQDIEWALFEGKFYILQARPITTNVKIDRGVINLWDNSNIVESYGGLTLPLTFGFAKYVYHSVYVQFCEILLVPTKEIREMDFFLKNMLGIFYGRIYYNLLNWYKLTSILPGFKHNRSFMETMMGTDEALTDELADRIKPPASQDTLYSKFKSMITGFKFFYFHLNIQNIVDNFLKYFYEHYEKYRKIDYSTMSSDQLLDYYHEMEKVFLNRWKAPIINDFLCMVHFGLLKTLCTKWLPDLGEAIQNDLLASDGNLESAEPTKVIIRMADYVRSNPEIYTFIKETPADECMEALTQSDFTEFKDKVDSYIDRFGFRCMSEMKLEQKDLWQEPKTFFVFLKNQLNNSTISLADMENREAEIRIGSENKVKAALNPIKRLIFFWSLKHARKAVRNRENTRFCRTRVYGIVRSIFYNMGRDLTNRGVLDHEDHVFYLTVEELKGCVEGTNPIMNLRPLIEARMAEYKRFEEIEPTPRFMTRGPVYWLNSHFEEEDVEVDLTDIPEGCLKGIPCCPGIIEGTVKLIMSPDDDLELNGDILVAMRTDPGWVPLYPSASALLVERGGLLSHSAIVAREMGLPAIVSIKNLTKTLKTGMKIRMNGETGLIEILEDVSE